MPDALGLLPGPVIAGLPDALGLPGPGVVGLALGLFAGSAEGLGLGVGLRWESRILEIFRSSDLAMVCDFLSLFCWAAIGGVTGETGPGLAVAPPDVTVTTARDLKEASLTPRPKPPPPPTA